jgi:hypothetical protein
MELAAQEIDVALDGPPRGGILLGVHREACSWRGENGALTTLLVAPNGPLPMAMTVAAPPAFSFADHLAAGQRVGVRGGIVRFSGCDLSVDTRPARHWDGRLDRAAAPPGESAVRFAWTIVAKAGVPSARAFCLLDEAVETSKIARLSGAKVIPDLVSATEMMDHEGASNAAVALLGRGHGLTPSGDDFLVGFLAGLWTRVGDSANRQTFLDTIGGAIVSGLERTTPVSATYLRAAADGRAGAAIHSVVGALKSDRRRGLELVIRRAMDIGHESGTCAMIGLLSGLDSWSDSGSPITTMRRPC